MASVLDSEKPRQETSWDQRSQVNKGENLEKKKIRCTSRTNYHQWLFEKNVRIRIIIFCQSLSYPQNKHTKQALWMHITRDKHLSFLLWGSVGSISTLYALTKQTQHSLYGYLEDIHQSYENFLCELSIFPLLLWPSL